MNSLRHQKTWSLPSLHKPFTAAQLFDPGTGRIPELKKIGRSAFWGKANRHDLTHVVLVLGKPSYLPLGQNAGGLDLETSFVLPTIQFPSLCFGAECTFNATCLPLKDCVSIHSNAVLHQRFFPQ